MSADRLIAVGRVAGAFGVRGEVRITAFTEDPLALGRYRALKRQDGSPALVILSAREAKGGVVVRCEGVESKEQADALRGLRLFVSRDSLPAPEGERIGKVKSVQDFGAGDILEISPEEGGPTWYLPFTREAVPEVRIAQGELIAVRPTEVE